MANPTKHTKRGWDTPDTSEESCPVHIIQEFIRPSAASCEQRQPEHNRQHPAMGPPPAHVDDFTLTSRQRLGCCLSYHCSHLLCKMTAAQHPERYTKPTLNVSFPSVTSCGIHISSSFHSYFSFSTKILIQDKF